MANLIDLQRGSRRHQSGLDAVREQYEATARRALPPLLAILIGLADVSPTWPPCCAASSNACNDRTASPVTRLHAVAFRDHTS